MDIAKIINNFEETLEKKGAKSSSKSKSQVDRSWKKSKDNYSKLKAQYDKLQKEADKINARLDATKELLTSAKQDMLHYYKTKQLVDLSGASSVVMYENDTRDVGYVIDKEEYYLDLNDARDLVKVPMKEHKKSSKPKKEELAEDAEDLQEDKNDADVPIVDLSTANQEDNWPFFSNFRLIDDE